ncbi:transcriptional regulator, HxlR family [Actinoalloteichus sp. GBA129-24]|uniref:Transcriptional regulator, HxlR family n=1 Tax=Actinoalloteichus fjordicus TaxID=1612552 RepID=A0AAC9PRJ9_9PSEU|nr:transcriptional regulator, HxlR family [Actinoalloteichus fjordicus]APU20067.1 transcriptional regulator, HxlR family [Actinoalloteichus sp. GBA129-24]
MVLHALRDGPRRPVELRATIGGVSTKVLLETLQRLNRDALLRREAHDRPPGVDYALTELGRSLLPALDALSGWADEHGAEIATAQEAADGRDRRS